MTATAQSGSFSLRPMTAADLPVVLSWRNSEHIRESMFHDEVIGWDEHVAWYQRMQDCQHMLAYVFQRENRSLGVVTFTDLDRSNGRAHWGFYLGQVNTEPGVGSAMGFLGLAQGFDCLGFHKIIGEVLASNPRSIAFHRKLGFRQEGLFRRHVMRRGTYEDVLSFSMLGEEWQAQRPALLERIFGENYGAGRDQHRCAT